MDTATDTGVTVPAHSRYVIIGAGIHGLSTGWHLARELRRRGLGGGEDVLILDKTGVGAGASGIACGVIRNNYFQPAMRELMAHSVGVWESDPDAFAYHPVGYLQIAPEGTPGHSHAMAEAAAQPQAQQRMLHMAEALAATGADLLADSRLWDTVREEFATTGPDFPA